MKDYLIKALAFEGKIRAYAIRSTHLVNELQKSHQTTPVASAALGRAATVGAMMGAMLKGEERLTIQIKGDGPIGQIIIDANAKGIVRGYITNGQVDLPLNEKGKLDVASAVGKGHLYVIKDLGLKDYYVGSVPLISGELGEDFTYYFAHSEQIPSAVGVGVLVNPDYQIRAAGGFIIQILPGMSDDDIQFVEQRLAELNSVTNLIDQGLSPEQILESLLGEIKILEQLDIKFQCNCSHERIDQMLIGLGKEEIENMIEKEGKAEITCQFCNKKYHYDKEDLERLLLHFS
ncbi:Hsp33 family molecular chaperone HslO [Tepidibacillus fermentans]|uniref:33 kDa chaperonin n=1 Tax=Tepidibacillus fermentans TaxID=1281767 RepID=A0A4R3KBX7_9BACI|nr:Hsp33 family molecular chaperone HslO [Tepidibacillus fermentans]TCS80141.1 molecular chaperone Hsp33 [Tepidibacillus fermentans]